MQPLNEARVVREHRVASLMVISLLWLCGMVLAQCAGAAASTAGGVPDYLGPGFDANRNAIRPVGLAVVKAGVSANAEPCTAAQKNEPGVLPSAKDRLQHRIHGCAKLAPAPDGNFRGELSVEDVRDILIRRAAILVPIELFDVAGIVEGAAVRVARHEGNGAAKPPTSLRR